MPPLQDAPAFEREAVATAVARAYGLQGVLSGLASERDQNFRLDASDGRAYVVKIANGGEDPEFLAAQNAVLARVALQTSICPTLVNTLEGGATSAIFDDDGRGHVVRVVSFLHGVPMAEVSPRPRALVEDLGRRLGQLDRALLGFDHPALHREFAWDLAQGLQTVQRHAPLIADAEHRGHIQALCARFERHTAPLLAGLRTSAIHNDANDHNVIVAPDGSVSGLIDFGDMVHSYTVAELAVAAAYAVLDQPEPLDVIAAVTAGYHAEYPLKPDEIEALYGLICLRLCVSASMAAYQTRQRPDEPYLEISQGPIRAAVPKLLQRPFELGVQVVRTACDHPPPRRDPPPSDVVLARRRQRIGPSLSIGYDAPIHLQRGWMQYLYDVDGRRYLDAYNNVPHVGHCHPRVVAAAVDQQRRLNTNTRYLYDGLGLYAERLAATLPDPLEVCFFVNSASEANELALRLVRAATGRKDTLVLDVAYHGHTTSLIDISPYKHGGPGGTGPPDWVHVAPLPDTVADADVVARLLAEAGPMAAFVAETCPSVAGQRMLPDGYLAEVYRQVRDAGGLCIADEVQTGYGRLGTCWYAFEEHAVVPDIVVLGKPIGNGHPIGAVVTTVAIAQAFANGMEFFSTFGGNAVSCEVGLAVLDVIADEGLIERARAVGDRLLAGLRELARTHAAIADVRGKGLFLGAELLDASGAPATALASSVSNAMRSAGVLIGTDGLAHNVLKIRPPMPFNLGDADRLLETLDRALSRQRS